MHPNSAFRWDDRDAMRGFVAEIAFGTLFAATPDGPRVAHVPAVWMGDALCFHLARGNGLTRHLAGATALFVVNGPDGYISPDWYALDANQVPTWNYVTVELEGPVRRMERDELAAQADALVGAHEERIADKTPWTRDKADAKIMDKMMDAIVGFAMTPLAWRGTNKLGQNKPDAARIAAADAVEAQGRRAIAHMMRSVG
jgi:transcriptional regulator